MIAVLDSSHRALTDQSTFYVEISRARYDAVVLTDNLEQLVEVLASDTGERPTAWEGISERHAPDPERLARALKEKAPVWTPRREWSALETRARSEGTVLFLVEGYGQLIERTRLLARTPDLPAEIREVTDGLLAYELACRDHGGAADEFLGLLEDHAGRRRALDAAAEAERRAVAGLDDYPDWREMAARLAGNGADVVAVAEGRPPGAAEAVSQRLEDLRALLAIDDASLAFEALRIEIEGRAVAAETIPFYCEGYGELVEQARALIPLTAPDTCMRGAAEAAIEDHDACVKRHEEIGALRDAAAACVEARAGLEARAVGEPPTGLEGYAAWSADCEAAEERWNAIRDDPDTWQPHLDRRGGDAEEIEADLGRLAGLRGLDAAWSDLLEERPAIAEEARARGCDAFDLDRWDGFVEKARALAEWPDLPEAAAEAAARVLDYDARCRTVRDFAAGVGTHGERRDALEEEAALWRSEDPGTSITDLAGYAPLSSFARELVQRGETIRNDETGYAPHLARLPGGGEGFAAALDRLDWLPSLEPVSGPWLFLGAVGRTATGESWECLAACAWPIVGTGCPIPVDSHYERRALGSLRRLVDGLEADPGLRDALGGAVRVGLEKPLAAIEVTGGGCLPDFLLTVARPGAHGHLPGGPGQACHRGRFDPRDRARYVIEVMGSGDSEYEEKKKVTHARMRRIGPVFRMEGGEFSSSANPLGRQRERIADAIASDLRRRWTAT